MSRGGFRGGRGGGRGGFGRGQIDVELQGLEYSFHDVPLFPDMQFPAVFKELAPAERELLDTDKKWITAFKELPYHIEAPIVRDEIERYSDRFKSWLRPKNKSLTLIPTDLMFFPDELQQVKDPSKKPVSKTSKGGFDLEKRLRELEKEESSKKGKTDGILDDDEENVDQEYDEEDEEEADDYQNDYYDDDHDGVGGDDSDGGGGGDY